MANSKRIQDTGSEEVTVTLSSSKIIAYSSILITLGASIYTFFSAIPELKKLHDDNIRIETNLDNSTKQIDEMDRSIKKMDEKLDNAIIELKELSVKAAQKMK